PGGGVWHEQCQACGAFGARCMLSPRTRWESGRGYVASTRHYSEDGVPKMMHSGSIEAPLRIVVVGCGAIARAFHLPALASIPGVADCVTVVDRDLGRAHAAQREFRANRAATDHR